METSDFRLILLTEQSPDKVFQAITNVRDWWSGYYSEEFSGATEKLNDEFSFRAGGGAHYSRQKLVEVIPNKKIVWLITESELSFLEKTDEWTGTKVIFEISKNGSNTQLTFIHQGLTPEIECFDSCAPAWTQYVQNKLLPLINKSETTNKMMESKNFTTTILVDQNPETAFNAIKNFRAWWSVEIEGNTDKLNETFFYHHKDVHLCKIQLIEINPDKKLVYLVLDNEFNFIEDKSEWVNTKLIFQITTEGDKTRVQFTHEGLVPECECYDVCNDAWTSYIQGSLQSLIATGKGKPNPKEGGLNAELVEKWGLPKK